MKAFIGMLVGTALVAGSLMVSVAPAAAQPRTLEKIPGHLCLRADQRSLLFQGTEGEDAYARAAQLGNRCYTALGLGQRTLLPMPLADPLDNTDYYFLPRSTRRALGLPQTP